MRDRVAGFSRVSGGRLASRRRLAQRAAGLLAASIVAAATAGRAQAADPAWSSGRSNGQLQVNAGPNFGNVQFEIEFANKNTGTIGGSEQCSGQSSCVPCDMVIYNSVADGYQGRGPGSCLTPGACASTENSDIWHPSGNSGVRHMLIKDSVFENSFTFDPAENHIDTIQFYKLTYFGGWVVFQDSVIKNDDIGSLIRFGNIAPAVSNGYGTGMCKNDSRGTQKGIVFQGVTLDNDAWFLKDCAARRAAYWPGASCNVASQDFSAETNIVVWLINVTTGSGSTAMRMQNGISRVVIVGNTPAVTYDTAHGWAGTVVKYAHIEDALAAGEAEPPFVRLSATGWAKPPAGSSTGTPSTPPTAPPVPPAIAPPSQLAPVGGQ